MQSTYINATNTATNGLALGADPERDVVVHKVIVGLPVSAGNIWLYSIRNPVNAATTNIAAKITLPTFSTTNVNPGVYVFDFGGGNFGGLVLNEGGNCLIDQTMQVTVIWSYLDESVQA